MFRGNPPYGRLHVLSETYQKALVLPREIDVQIDKIQVSTLPPDHPFPDETVLSLSLVKSYGKVSKLFKKECSLKRASSTEKDQTCEITSGTPGDPLVKFSIGKSEGNQKSQNILGLFSTFHCLQIQKLNCQTEQLWNSCFWLVDQIQQ